MATREEQEAVARVAFTAIGIAPATVECVLWDWAGRQAGRGGEGEV
jgi:hypothetical protein